MAALGELSCSTNIGQSVVFGLLSGSVYSMCSSDERMCCTCTTHITTTLQYGSQTEVITDPPLILQTVFPGFFHSTRYNSCSSDTECGRDAVAQPHSDLQRFYRRQERDVSQSRSCNCVGSDVVQSIIGLFFLVSLTNIIGSCSSPAAPPIPILPLIPPLPPQPDPIVPIRTLLLSAILGPVASALGASLPSDGCPRDEVMVGGVCSPLLESVPPCPPPQWVVLNATVDPPEGSCGTRLCGRGRVFLVSDQLCHDVREPGLCPDDKRMYITAYGSPVCDCYEGEFPDVSGKCHPLFSQGPCPAGELWGPSEDNTSFACEPQRCPSTDGGFAEVPFEDGICFLLGSQGPCAANEILGFSISRAKAVCTTLEEAGYEIPFERVRELDELYPRFAPPRFQVDFAEIFNNRIVKRQVGNLVSDPVIPNINLNVAPNPGTILQTPLLTQCRPGAQLDVNFKCRDIIIGPNVDPTTRGMHAPPVPPLQSCPSNLCFDDRAQCVTCDQAVVNTCALSASLNLQQTSCQALSVGLG